MIRALVDFALRNRRLVLGGAVLLFAWGILSFRNLPIETYPGRREQLCAGDYAVAWSRRGRSRTAGRDSD